MSLFLVIWVAVMWGVAELMPPLASGIAVICGVVAFWLLVPKRAVARPLARWMIAPLAAAFVAGLLLASFMAWIDRDLVTAGYGVWFVSWLQFGLWLKDRFSRPAPTPVQ